MNYSRGFTYLDTIFGLTALLLLIGFIYGSIQIVRERTVTNQLTTIADAFSNELLNELSLRIYDENIENFRTLGLTIKNDFGADEAESQADLSSLDDIDDFHGISVTNPAYSGMTATIELDYVEVDTMNSTVTTSIPPTTLKRAQIEIAHARLRNPYRTSQIFGANMLPEELINPPYVTKMLLVDETPGINIIMPGDALSFKVAFNENVFVTDAEADFSLYINLNFGILTGDIGTYQNRASLPGEVKADYVSGDGTDTLLFRYEVEENHASTDIDQFLGYTNELTIQNGRLVNSEDKEMINSLPGPDSEDSNFDQYSIIGLLEPIESYIYTAAELDSFNQQNNEQFFEQSPTEIFNNWPRTERNVYYANKADAENGERWYSCLNHWGTYTRGKCASIEWELLANPERVSQPENVWYLNTFISPDSLEKFTFEATLSSNDADDDYIGLVIAYERNKKDICNAEGEHDPNTCITEEISGGINNSFLVLMRSGNGVSPLTGNVGRFGVLYWLEAKNGSGRFRNLYWTKRVFNESTAGNQNWRNNQYTRVKIMRDGNIIKAWTGPFTNVLPDPDNPQYSDDIIEIDLASDNRLHKFIGKRQYGYATYSQARSQYYDVQLLGGVTSRLDVNILISGSGSETSVDEFYKANDDGNYIQQDVSTLQSVLGYPRQATNPSTGNIFVVTSNNVIFYPGDWP